ncbi:hypothetical protein KAW18_02250 [candidate division WOR-3 bacterium]|nr:hypothetical protein [candidate division WOR-3 bacterium]
MKSKAEEKLDKAFEGIGIRPRIYHYTDIHPFRAVTVAVGAEDGYTWSEVKGYIVDSMREGVVNEYGRATHLLKELRGSYSFYGVAICDKSDNFSRKEGRNRARGRLFKHLKKEGEKCKNEN